MNPESSGKDILFTISFKEKYNEKFTYGLVGCPTVFK